MRCWRSSGTAPPIWSGRNCRNRRICNLILNEGLIRAMDEVGRRFSSGEFFLPEMLLAAKTMKAGLEVLRPHLSSNIGELLGTVVIATVKGDLHDIGKNLVAMMLEGAGFKVINLGVDVDADGFVRAAEEHKADLVCMSALLTTTMPAMAATVKAVRACGSPAADPGGRCAGHTGLCRSDRRRRVWRRCPRSGGHGPETDGRTGFINNRIVMHVECISFK